MIILDRPAVAAALAAALAPTLAVEYDAYAAESAARQHDSPIGRAVEARLRAIAAESTDPAVRALFGARSMSVRVAMRDGAPVLMLSSRTHQLDCVIGTLHIAAGTTALERRMASVQRRIDDAAATAIDVEIEPWVREQAARNAARTASEVIEDEDRRDAAAQAVVRARDLAHSKAASARHEAAIAEVMAALDNDSWPSYIHRTPANLRAEAERRLAVRRVEQDN